MQVKTYAELAEYLGMFRNRNCDVMIITGRAGLGKTAMASEVLKGTLHKVILSHCTSLALYKIAYENMDNLLVFDDLDSFIENRDNISLLKQICETKPRKRVEWHSTSPRLQKLGVPSSFTTSSKILLIGNDYGLISKTLHPIIDRGIYIEFAPTTNEILKKMESILPGVDSIPIEQRQEVLEVIKENAMWSVNLSLRTLVKACYFHKEFPDWKGKLLKLMDLSPKLIELEKLMELPNDKERIAKWQGSERDYYNWKKRYVQNLA